MNTGRKRNKTDESTANRDQCEMKYNTESGFQTLRRAKVEKKIEHHHQQKEIQTVLKTILLLQNSKGPNS